MMNASKITEGNSVGVDIDCSAYKPAQPDTEGNDETEVRTFARKLNYWFEKKKCHFATVRNIALLLLYLAYYGYAMYCHFGDEASIRLTVFTGFGLVYLSWANLQKLRGFHKSWKAILRYLHSTYSVGKTPTVIRWSMYLLWTALFVVYIIINVALKDARNLRPLGGMAAYIILLFALSTNRRQINWNCVFYGTILQCLFGLFIIKTKAGTTVLVWFSDRLEEFLAYSDVGSEFIFGEKYLDHYIAMKIMPSLIVFVAFITVLIYLGAIQFIVQLIGSPLAYLLGVSSPEATVAVANIMLGPDTACVAILEYLPKMSKSSLCCILISGMASCTGTALIFYMAFGVPLKLLLSASAMSAPAALVCAKLVFPDKVEDDEYKTSVKEVTGDGKNKLLTQLSSKDFLNKCSEETVQQKQDEEPVCNDKLHETIDTKDDAKEKMDHIYQRPRNLGEALVVGTKDGAKLVVYIISLAIVSYAIIEFLDATVVWFGERVDLDISLKIIMSYLFYPFAFIMGIDTEDCLKAGEMLGIRTLTGPSIPYITLGELISNREQLANYTAFIAASNETFTYDRTGDIFLPHWNMTLPGGFISDRSEVIVVYALCGYASTPSLSILIGIVATFIPQRLQEVTNSGTAIRLLLAGTIASYLTACVAGLLT